MTYILTHADALRRLSETIFGTYKPHPDEIASGVRLAELRKLMIGAGWAAPELMDDWLSCVEAQVFLRADDPVYRRADHTIPSEPHLDASPAKALLAWVEIAIDAIVAVRKLPSEMHEVLLIIAWESLTS